MFSRDCYKIFENSMFSKIAIKISKNSTFSKDCYKNSKIQCFPKIAIKISKIQCFSKVAIKISKIQCFPKIAIKNSKIQCFSKFLVLIEYPKRKFKINCYNFHNSLLIESTLLFPVTFLILSLKVFFHTLNITILFYSIIFFLCHQRESEIVTKILFLML
jgi:hypothetical protein